MASVRNCTGGLDSSATRLSTVVTAVSRLGEDVTVTSTPGYSGTPLHRKLGVEPGHRVLLRGAPAGWDATVLDPDATADVHRRAGREPYDVVLLFCPDVATMAAGLSRAMAVTTTPGRCWVAWPKKSSAAYVDLTEDVVRAAALAVGWVDVKVCAVDAVWSGLCLVRRKENR
jgi:hypothetical protein